MRTVICGSRSAPLVATFMGIAQSGIQPTVVISGTAGGADTFGEAWAKIRGIPVEQYPAAWETHGKAAGHIRNALMVSKAEAMIAIWDGVSPGTKNAIELAEKSCLVLYVYRYR